MKSRVNPHNENAAVMWSATGRSYDEVSRFVASGIEHCVERLAPKAGERVLDVATGTGWTSRRVAAWGASVVGVDIAEGMLTAAKEIAKERNYPIEYETADAESLPFGDSEFDAVVSTFGAMFAPDQTAVVGELARVCRPGGRLALACWTPDSMAVEMRSVLGPYVPPPPASPPPSPFNWGQPEWLQGALGDSFELKFERGTLFHRVPDGGVAWDFFAQTFGPIRAVASALNDERRMAARADMAALFDTYADGIGLSIPYDYLVTLGVRK